MLKAFRDNLKYLGWVLWLVIAVFVLFIFSDFGGIQLGGTTPTDAAATIGDIEVSFAEFERSYRQSEDYYRQTLGEQFNRELAQQMGLPMQVMDQLIAEKIILDEADRMGLRITTGELVQYISEIPAFQFSDGRFVGKDRYSQILRSNGFTVDEFEGGARSDLLTQKVRAVLSENMYVSDEEVVDSYKKRTETASIRYLRLPSDRLRDELDPADEELAEHFSQNGEDFRVPERRVVDYLLVDPDSLRSTIELTDGEINAYYDENPDDFTQDEQVHARHILLQINADRTDEQAEQQMQEIRQRLTAGEDFAALALELSDDPGSKTNGGDLGFFGRGQMIPEFETAAFDAQPGDLVGPVKTSFGYHLIEVVEKQPAGKKPLDQASEEIRNLLLTERAATTAETTASELVERLEKEAVDSAAGMRTLAESESGVTIHSSEPFGQDDNVPGIGRGTSFTTAAFDLEEGAFSEVVRVNRGWAILRLDTIEEPHLPEFDQVRDDVRNSLLDQRQLELASSRLAEARLSLQEGQALEDVATELGVTLEESGEIRQVGPIAGLGNNPEIAALAMELNQGDFGGPVVHNRDVVLFEVTERQRYDPLKFEQDKDSARENLRQERLGQMLSSIITQRRDELGGVKYDNQLMSNFELVDGEG
jgi:peptidyl-prolyl cis-trans isomerase D